MLYYLVYLSSATELYSNSDLSDILSTSRKNNTAKDVTGLLLYHEGNILQVLEGDQDVVLSLYEKIATDERHHQILKMVSGTIEERNFPDWSMGFKTVSDDEWKDLSGYFKLNSSGLLSHLVNSNKKVHTAVNSFMTVNFR